MLTSVHETVDINMSVVLIKEGGDFVIHMLGTHFFSNVTTNRTNPTQMIINYQS